MTGKIACLLINGEIPQQGIDTFVGLLILGGLLFSIVGMYYKFNKIKKDRAAEYNDRLDSEVEKRSREIEERIKLYQTLQELKDSNNRMSDAMVALNETMRVKFERVEIRVDEHERQITRAMSSTRSAHKRLDEHRKVEHNIHNGRTHPNEDDEKYETYESEE